MQLGQQKEKGGSPAPKKLRSLPVERLTLSWPLEKHPLLLPSEQQLQRLSSPSTPRDSPPACPHWLQNSLL